MHVKLTLNQTHQSANYVILSLRIIWQNVLNAVIRQDVAFFTPVEILCGCVYEWHSGSVIKLNMLGASVRVYCTAL